MIAADLDIVNEVAREWTCHMGLAGASSQTGEPYVEIVAGRGVKVDGNRLSGAAYFDGGKECGVALLADIRAYLATHVRTPQSRVYWRVAPEIGTLFVGATPEDTQVLGDWVFTGKKAANYDECVARRVTKWIGYARLLVTDKPELAAENAT